MSQSGKKLFRLFNIDPENYVQVGVIAAIFGFAGYVGGRKFTTTPMKHDKDVPITQAAWEGKESDSFKYKYIGEDGKEKTQPILKEKTVMVGKATAEAVQPLASKTKAEEE